jgi:DNA end-binding protein Ku
VAPRPYWKGYLKLSLVSCPIALFPATSEREKISFHQLNKDTGNRIRYRKVDAETGDEVARGKGLLGTTLRYPYEVLSEKEYFEDIPDEKVPKDMLDLAVHIVESKRGEFDPEKFEDEYEEAVKDLLRKKQSGQTIEKPREPVRTNVVNLMDALRASLKSESAGASARPAKKGKRRVVGQREMLLPIPGKKGKEAAAPARSGARQKKAG